MPLDPSTKLAKVREAMAKGDWHRAIRLAARFRSLGRQAEPIHRAKDALNNPEMYRQLARDVDTIVAEGIAALKERFSISWDSLKNDGERKKADRRKG